MSWNSMCKLGCDVILGDVQAKNISCKSITVDDPTDPTIPTEITIDTVNCQTGNFDVINVQTLNVTDPDDPTVPTDINVNSITAQTGNIETLTTNSFTSSSASISSPLNCNS